MGSKINSLVQFPLEGLDIARYFVPRPAAPSEPPALYDLYAVANHMGTMRGGHYTAYAKGADELWREFDDERVSQVDPNRCPVWQCGTNTVASSSAALTLLPRPVRH